MLLFVSINGAVVVVAAELDGTKLSHHLTIVNFLQVHHGEAEKSLFTVLIQNGYKKICNWDKLLKNPLATMAKKAAKDVLK